MRTEHNRIIIGLPARLERAKQQLAVFEKRLNEIALLADDKLVGDEEFRKLVKEILGDS